MVEKTVARTHAQPRLPPTRRLWGERRDWGSTTATGMGQLLLHVTTPDQESAGLTPRAVASGQTRQAEPITLLRVVVSGPGIPTPIVVECPIPGPVTPQCEVIETPNAFIVTIALLVPVGTERLVVVTGFDQTGAAILRGMDTVDLTQPLQAVTVMLAPVQANTPPQADAGPDQTVAVGATVTLLGNGSSDADGDPLTFAWELLVRPPGSQAALSNPTSVNPTFVVDRPGSYMAQLTVNDGDLDSLPATVTITSTAASLVSLTVTPPNPQLAQGTTQAFTAMGLFTDGSLAVIPPPRRPGIRRMRPSRPSAMQRAVRRRATGIATWRPHRHQCDRAPESGRDDYRDTLLSVTAARLVALTVTSPNAQLAQGTNQALAATGLLTASGSQDLTTQATWHSSDAAIATISNAAGSQGRADEIATLAAPSSSVRPRPRTYVAGRLSGTTVL